MSKKKKSPPKRKSAAGESQTKKAKRKPAKKTAAKTDSSDTQAQELSGDKPGDEGETKTQPEQCVIVGIGASAGGLEAYKRLLKSMPDDTGMAFVLVQHLDPTHESLMVELLSKYTPMPVLQVENAMPVQPNHIYMIPPNHFIEIRNGGLFLAEPVTKRGVRLPIDYFFTSLAEARKERAICIVLSGTGSDGAAGMRDVKAEGGMTIVQQPDSAEYDGMPRAAIQTGAIDMVLPLEEIPDVIIPYAQHPYVQAKRNVTLADTAPDHFRAILSLLQAHTDQDFSRYKKGTLTRRIDRRMGIRQISSPADYLRLLRDDGDELRHLFKDFLIGVTRFFRDDKAWEDLTNVLTQIILDKRDEEPFRVWVPGCATGEEAYSIAMLIFEQLQRHNRRLDVQVFATDIDRDAIDVARVGLYPENITKDLSDARIDSYFQREGDKLRVRKKLRETCIFAVQNVLSDPPFSNLDLISCRNLLIYLEPDVQKRVFDMFHFALKPEGLLLLGTSESPAKRKHLFEVLSQSSRIYRKVGESKPGRGGFPIDSSKPRVLIDKHVDADAPLSAVGTVELSKRALLEEFAPASVVVNHRGLIQYIHGPVRNYLDFPSGEPDLELASMALEGLKAKTRTALQQARGSNETVAIVAPRVRRNGGHVSVRIRVRPLPIAKQSEPLYLVSFLDEATTIAPEPNSNDSDGDDASAAADNGENRISSDRQLALELQATREDLQSTIEELESSNEELKASNEEVMSMNEELQSTNEELETSREELQSLNEELSTVNNQLHDKVGELEATTNDLTNLLTSTDTATLFLDSDLRIRRFTPAMVRLMSIIDSDVGRPISDLAPRVNDPALVDDAKEVLAQLTPVEKEVKNGGDKWYMRRIMPFRTSENKIEGVVVTFTDVTGMKQAAQRLEFREQQQAAIARLGRAALVGTELPSLFDRAVAEVTETLNFDLCKLLRLSDDRKQLDLVAGVGWKEGLVGNASVPTGIESQGGYTLQTAGPILVRDLRKEKRFSGPALLTEHDVISGVSVIIGPEESPWGVLGVHARREVNLTIDDANFVQAVANVLWEAIRNEQIEAELADEQTRTSAFLNNTAVIAWMKDEQGRHVYLSETYERRFGVRREDWMGKTDEEVWPQEIAEHFRKNDDKVLQTNQMIEVEEWTRTSAGDEAVFFVTKFPFTDSQGQRYVGGLGVDISERKKAEEQLRASEELVRTVMENSTQAMVMMDDRGYCTYCNQAWLVMTGYDAEEIRSAPLHELVHHHYPDGQPYPMEECPIDRALPENHDVRAHEDLFFRKDGTTFPVLCAASPIFEDGKPISTVLEVRDMTIVQQTERRIKEGEERLRLAATLAGFGTYYANLESGEVAWSDELKKIFGLDPKDDVPIQAGDVPDFVHEDDRAHVATKIEQSLDPAGTGEFRDEHRIVRPDGSMRWILMQGRTVFRGQGADRRAVRTAGVAIDITDRHEFEAALEEARQIAEAANEAKSVFLANMSHELSTPMTAILGYADVLHAQLEDPDAQACIKTIKQNGVYLCDLLNDILDLSKIESGKLEVHIEPQSPVEILADVRSLMAVRATEKSLTLNVEFEGKIPDPIETDRKMLRQVLINLVGNAIKFTDEGYVRIEATWLEDNEMLQFSITDTGMGIPDDRIDTLFQPFEQLDNSATRVAGGSGLGLAISRRLVEQLGGQLTVESVVDEGSTFRVNLPVGSLDDAKWILPDAGALLREPAKKVDEDLPSLSGRILAVDDRPEIRYLVRRFVEAAGGQVETANNGNEAIENWKAAHQSDKPFDAVVMDVQMPTMDGLEATRRLRAEGFKGTIIALTANALRRDQAKCLEAGCDDFLPKPIDQTQLIHALAKHLGNAEQTDGSGDGQQLSVLYVEDNATARASQKILLEQRGYAAEAVASGDEALRILDEFKPDVMLLDLGLDGMTGQELLEQLKLKPELSKCTFICLSGRQEDEVDWQAMGFDYYLQKPADMDQLESLLSELGNDSQS